MSPAFDIHQHGLGYVPSPSASRCGLSLYGLCPDFSKLNQASDRLRDPSDRWRISLRYRYPPGQAARFRLKRPWSRECPSDDRIWLAIVVMGSTYATAASPISARLTAFEQMKGSSSHRHWAVLKSRCQSLQKLTAVILTVNIVP
jgi:hypothetical protein